MNKFLLSILLMLFVTSSFAKQPNIIVMMADDLGWGEVGVQGSKIVK